jgi:16S rRNA (guanine527-N7)-methyltransferase
MTAAADLLKTGIAELGMAADDRQIDSFLLYLSELKKWAGAYNLTGLRSDRDIVVKHFLDSVLFSKVLPEDLRSVADVGSGAGFPGIPLAIMRPDVSLILMEPTEKKANFLRHICRTLHLGRTEVLQARIESVRGVKCDAAVTRALFTVSEFIGKARHLLNPGGVIVLSKGPRLEAELSGLDRSHISVVDLKLPIENMVRHMVIVSSITHSS